MNQQFIETFTGYFYFFTLFHLFLMGLFYQLREFCLDVPPFCTYVIMNLEFLLKSTLNVKR